MNETSYPVTTGPSGGSNPPRGSQVAEQAKGVARAGTEQVRQVGESLRTRAFQELEHRRGLLAGEVDKLASALEGHHAEGGASQVLDFAASSARRLSSSLNERSAEALLRDLGRNPAAVLAGSFALGFLAFRLFKA